MKPIPDHIKENLDVLFVGFNPSIRSSETGHHFANPTNRFWSILYKAKITDRKYLPTEDEKLLDLGYGFTNIVARPTKNAQEISSDEYRIGRDELKAKIAKFQPKIVCFVGKGVYQQYSGRKKASWGKQSESIIPGVVDFVAPSSSGLVRMGIDDIAEIYSEIPRLIDMINFHHE
ncbi:G/U mismatch-specific DNA glycosylase [Lederbergia wuyishanensis]|uniref:TDG/mug DNA glycosylase family protein n=1 Tax=Lederbergia wuyishanensis TaxID=1347903 RepID=A0ABU0D0B4_9BACI|nr:G/U mismatch-specific DNA glycosylase [Lederbergia wuyishanensis]MCJ8006456.1 G/U mismatch-specific DNA glycosylase [Lederbergia wuyishanensis]MDQ0341832.1 TDG/mug DNA glycosylase family protein [Lederbergia wuyishanensis]